MSALLVHLQRRTVKGKVIFTVYKQIGKILQHKLEVRCKNQSSKAIKDLKYMSGQAWSALYV
jgi:hypothetical protein